MFCHIQDTGGGLQLHNIVQFVYFVVLQCDGSRSVVVVMVMVVGDGDDGVCGDGGGGGMR